MEDVINVFKEVMEILTSSSIVAWMIRMWIIFGTFSIVLRLCMHIVGCTEVKPQKEDEARVNRIVGKILNDQEKIDYILKTYDDIEIASDMIADIYVKQYEKGEKLHD